jgi:hypothetical protein
MSHQGQHKLTAKDVIFVEGFEASASLFKNDATLRIKDLLTKIETICLKSGELSADEIAILFGNGLSCEVLRPGAADWQTGHLNLSLEFQVGTIAGLPPIAATPVVTAPIETPSPAPAVAAVATVAAVAAVAAVPSLDEDAFGDDLLGDDLLDGDMLSASLDDETPPAINFDTVGFAHPAPGDDLDLDLMDVMGDAAPESAGFDGLDDFSLDSAPAADLESLDSPWDLSDDLDSMLMMN